MIDSAPSATLSRVVSLVLAMLLAIPAGAVLAQDATPPARPAPLPEGFDELMAGKVDTVVDAAVRLRRLPDADGVAYRVVDKATFRSELEDLFGAEYSDAYVAAEDDLYTRLGLIAADVDLKEVTLSLHTAGFYLEAHEASDRVDGYHPLTDLRGNEVPRR